MKPTKTSSLSNNSGQAGENNAFWFFTISLGLFSLLLQLWFPWWILVVISWLLGYIAIPKKSFLIGFLSNAAVWFGYSFLIDLRNHSLLSEKVAEMTGLHYVTILILILSVVAGFMGGLACMSGKWIRQAYRKSEKMDESEESETD